MKRYEKTGIYTITSPSGAMYVGSAIDFSRRWSEHRSGMKKGIHHNNPLQNAFNKYGIENLIFEKIIFCKKEDLLIYEQIAIDCLTPEYNICKVAGSPIGRICSEETKRKIGLANKGRSSGPPSEETRKKMRDWQKNRPPASEETRRKMSESLKGKKRSEEFKENMRNIMLGRKLSDETRRRISIGKTGTTRPPISEETRKKMSDAAKSRPPITEETRRKIGDISRGSKHYLASPVRCVETGHVFVTQTAAQDWLIQSCGISKASSGNISKALAGVRKSAYGYTWEKA